MAKRAAVLQHYDRESCQVAAAQPQRVFKKNSNIFNFQCSLQTEVGTDEEGLKYLRQYFFIVDLCGKVFNSTLFNERLCKLYLL